MPRSRPAKTFSFRPTAFDGLGLSDDPETYPLASRVGTAAGEAQGGAYDAERAYRFGLERIIEALEP